MNAGPTAKGAGRRLKESSLLGQEGPTVRIPFAPAESHVAKVANSDLEVLGVRWGPRVHLEERRGPKRDDFAEPPDYRPGVSLVEVAAASAGAKSDPGSEALSISSAIRS